MNIDKLTQVRDHLKWMKDNDHADAFHMEFWLGEVWYDKDWDESGVEELTPNQAGMESLASFDCGTAGCIAGWVCALNAGEFPSDYVFDIQSDAQQILGLQPYEASYLFNGSWASVPLEDITIGQAIDQLDELIDHALTTLED